MKKDDLIWKALGDPTRRAMLDALSVEPRTTGELVAMHPGLSRAMVMKHLGVLERAGLVLVRREGRLRWNHFNPVPVEEVCSRWIGERLAGHSRNLRAFRNLVDHNKRRKDTP